MLLALIAVVFIAFRFRTSLRYQAETANILPAQEGEFLVIVAPFFRQGDEPQAIGGRLHQSLTETSDSVVPFRAELLSKAPPKDAVPNILADLSPQILVAGSYDDQSIQPTLYLNPPQAPFAAAQTTAGSSALAPIRQPRQFTLYAPLQPYAPLGFVEAWVRGQAYFWQGDFSQAQTWLMQAKLDLPRQVPLAHRTEMDVFAAHINWQLGYLSGPVAGNWAAARDFFAESSSQAPADLSSTLGLAAALAQLNELDRAASILQRALRSHPDSWQLNFALAEISLQQNDTAAGFSLYDRAITLLGAEQAPSSQRSLADVYFNRGYYRLTHNDPIGARDDLQQSVDLGRTDSYAYGNLAWAAYQTGDYQAATQISANITQIDAEQVDLRFNQGLYLLAAGQIDEAHTTYDEAINLTLTIDNTLARSTHFGIAYHDLEALITRLPDIAPTASEIRDKIDIANG